MSAEYAAQDVLDAYLDMIKRISTHYERYVGDMWSVVVLHTRHVLRGEAWQERIAPFEKRYKEQIELEGTLYSVANTLVSSGPEVADIRLKGLSDMIGLNEMHADLERDLLEELLAHPTMSVQSADESRWLSQHRLHRHATLRRRMRLEIDTAWFWLRDLDTDCVDEWSDFEQVDPVVAKKTIVSIRPLVVPS